IVFNNRSFGNVLRDQRQLYGGRVAGALLSDVDFVRVAEGLGVEGRRVGSPAELGEALAAALAADRPALLEVPLERGTETSPWPLIHMTERPSAMLGAHPGVSERR